MTSTTEPSFSLEQPASRGTAVLSFAVFMPAACSVFIPLGLVAAHAQSVASAMQEQPLAATQAGLGLLLWIGLFVVPVARRLSRLGLSRSLTISDGEVVETVTTLFGAHCTRRPLGDFGGIVHRVRTSVGGMHHELALVERQSGRDVVFLTAPHLSRAAIEGAMAALGLPEIRANDLLKLPQSFDLFRIAPQTTDQMATAAT